MFNAKQELSLNNIYRKLSEESIISRIIPGAKKNNFFSIRDEKNTSASISSFNGRLYIKDFGDASQPKAETWYQLIARKQGWDINSRIGFLQALNWANKEFNLDLEEPNIDFIRDFNIKGNSNTTQFKKAVNNSKKPVKIEVKRCKWSKEDLFYWNQYGIPQWKLEEKKIAPLSHFWLTNPNKDNVRYCFNTTNQLTFVYPYYRDKNNNFIYKIYSPNSTYKWTANVTADIIENWRFIKKRRKNLIVQSSFKDIIVCELFRDKHGVFEEYDFISPISEGIWFAKWEMIKSKYDKIIYWANNDWDKKDNPGIAYAKKWENMYGVPYIFNPDWAKASDISDYRKNTNEKETLKLMKDLHKKVSLLK